MYLNALVTEQGECAEVRWIMALTGQTDETVWGVFRRG